LAGADVGARTAAVNFACAVREKRGQE